MADYSTQDALEELHEVGIKILAKAERDVQKTKVVELAKMYALVRRESERLEEEARKLRLSGDLDREVYSELAHGYESLGRGILEIAKSRWLTADVYVLSKGLRGSVEKQWSSLAEYAQSEARK
jgi:hypothetical protein